MQTTTVNDVLDGPPHWNAEWNVRLARVHQWSNSTPVTKYLSFMNFMRILHKKETKREVKGRNIRVYNQEVRTIIPDLTRSVDFYIRDQSPVLIVTLTTLMLEHIKSRTRKPTLPRDTEGVYGIRTSTGSLHEGSPPTSTHMAKRQC